jgi:O-antigen ligase
LRIGSIGDRFALAANYIPPFLVFAAFLTIFDRGGNTTNSIVIACVLACAAASVQSLQTQAQLAWRNKALRFWWGALILITLVAIVGLLHIDPAWWLKLPGRSGYSEVIAALKSEPVNALSLPISMAPNAGLGSLILVLTSMALVFACATMKNKARELLLLALCALCLLQAMIGVAQIALPGASLVNIEYLGHVRAAGTFVNKNHYANLLAMLLPYALFRSFASASDINGSQRARPLRITLWVCTSLALFGAILLSLSRSGIFVSLIGGGLVIAWNLISTTRRGRSYRRAIAVACFVVAIAVLFLLTSESFFRAISDPGASGSLLARKQMTAATLQGAWALFPLGSGLGSFANAFPAFQPPTLLGFIEHAHNDYAQLLFEAGVIGLLAIICVSGAVIVCLRSSITREASGIGVACFAGAIAFALHAALDFPVRIPGLVLVAVFLFTTACVELPQTIERSKNIGSA